MFQQLDSQQGEIRQVISLYEARQATFESLACVFRCSPLEIWGMLTGGRYCALANSTGSPEDIITECDAATQSDEILLEFTAILTFAHLGLLERLQQRYKLFTVQPVLDAIAEAHAKVSMSQPSFTIGKEGDNYIGQEITPESWVEQKQFLERIMQFLTQSHITTLTVPALLENDATTGTMRRILGPISSAALLAARDAKLTLYSEDVMLRILGRSEWKVRGISAQPLLQELESNNLLSRDEHIAAIAKLVFLNFSVVQVNADNVLWVFDKVQYRTTGDTKKILSIFHGPQCIFESAVDVLADVTKRVWLEGALYHRKVDLTDGILDALGTNRPTNQVAEYFERAVKLRLFLAPQVADAIGKRILLWKERKLGRAGIIVSPRYRIE
jgi:hypothetical protein